MGNKKAFIRDEVVAEIQVKARRDAAFRKLLFANPPDALGEFGVVIPGSSGDGKNYTETLYAMRDRSEFYLYFNKVILNEFRDETVTMAPGLCVTAAEHEDVAWDFEVTSYAPK